jgi:hypothetical protein
MAQSANSLISVAPNVPLAQRYNNLFANSDSATHSSAFSKALLGLACWLLPDSISSCHPLSLFAIPSFSKEAQV